MPNSAKALHKLIRKKKNSIRDYIVNLYKCIQLLIRWKTGKIDDAYLCTHDYNELAAVKAVSISLFKKLINYVFEKNLNRLRKAEKIKIAFVAGLTDTWPGDYLYNKFLEDDRFDVQVLIHPFNNGTPSMIKNNFESIEKFIKEKGFRYRKVFKRMKSRCDISWASIGKPDVLIHLNHYIDAFPESLKITNLPLCTLNVYIPYGFTVIDNPQKQFNLITHNLYWMIMGDSRLYLYLARKYSDIRGSNVVFSGYTKMDVFMNRSKPLRDINELWKLNDNSGSQIKIIYAPHHSLGDAIPQLSTFDKNYLSMYLYAKEHPDTTSWIIKPHPFLKKEAISYGLFRSSKEFDDYLKMWDELPNAKVVLGGDYFDYFKTSDCMIQDSGSFLAEYLYVNKPMLFLTRESQRFNELGMQIMKVIYHAPGDCMEKIIHFIEHTVRNDTLKPARERLFKRHFDYVRENHGMLAYEAVHSLITNKIYGE